MKLMTSDSAWDEEGEPVVNEIVPFEPDAEEEWDAVSWNVRPAVEADLPALVACIGELLVEIGGKPAATEELEATARALIGDPDAGVLLVAEDEEVIVGVLGVSWQLAIRVPGRYGLIQELWVHPSWRGRTIGGDMILALLEIARERGIGRLEVGLPSERYRHAGATEAFYTNSGFTPIGLRMRRLL
jgi:GNAT superfamily N-acetyltransferase